MKLIISERQGLLISNFLGILIQFDERNKILIPLEKGSPKDVIYHRQQLLSKHIGHHDEVSRLVTRLATLENEYQVVSSSFNVEPIEPKAMCKHSSNLILYSLVSSLFVERISNLVEW